MKILRKASPNFIQGQRGKYFQFKSRIDVWIILRNVFSNFPYFEPVSGSQQQFKSCLKTDSLAFLKICVYSAPCSKKDSRLLQLALELNNNHEVSPKQDGLVCFPHYPSVDNMPQEEMFNSFRDRTRCLLLLCHRTIHNHESNRKVNADDKVCQNQNKTKPC